VVTEWCAAPSNYLLDPKRGQVFLLRRNKSVIGSVGASLFDRSLAPSLVAVVFVLLWSTGFIVARFAAPHSPPLVFLALRLGSAVLLLAAWATLARAPWPGARQTVHLVIAGLLVQACYLGGVWVAIAAGMPAGLTALIVNLQPVLTAMLAPLWLQERQSARAWVGLALGFGGVALVIAHRIQFDGLGLAGILLCVLALSGITFGTLWQKRFVGGFDLRTGTCIQYLASWMVLTPLAIALEGHWPAWQPAFWWALLWSVFGLSIGATFLMFLLMRRGTATRLASLFYLVPPVTAIMAWALFREPFGWLAALGMVVTGAGVWLVQSAPAVGVPAKR
jgi:drug/metabolite transporter (DMT)-like permease